MDGVDYRLGVQTETPKTAVHVQQRLFFILFVVDTSVWNDCKCGWLKWREFFCVLEHCNQLNKCR